MRIARSITLLLAVMPCLTVAVFAQTTSSGDASTAARKEGDTAPLQAPLVSGNTSDSGITPADTAASKSTASPEAKEPVAANAQGASSDKWQFMVAPYLWLAGIKGTIGVGDITTDIDPGVSDLLDALNFGFMGTFEARKNKFMVINDLIYISLEKTKETTGPLFGALTANQKVFMLSPVVGYRLLEKEGASLDAIAGIRFWHMNTKLELTPGQLAGRVREGSVNWADVIGGLRGQVHVARKVSLIGRGDLGGGGSDFTYQLFGGVGIDVSKKATMFVGYRYLDVKYDSDNFLFDAALKGVVLGAAFRF
ncbi:MAG TPA: hypothetical protein VFB82_01040 [Blastocatellia bacterium]|nr:hypothetical protein [Blastocatellia bacterium]